MLPNFQCASLAAATQPPTKQQASAPQVVIFSGGRLTVNSSNTTLGHLLDMIGAKARIGIMAAPSLRGQPISVHFYDLTLENGLKRIQQAAGIINRGVAYRQSTEPGKLGEWEIDKVQLLEKGKGTPSGMTSAVMESSANATNSRQPESLRDREKPLDKEAFFDKKLNRFVEVVKGEAMIRLAAGQDEDRISGILKSLGGSVISRSQARTSYRVRIPAGLTVGEFVDQQGKAPGIAIVEPNFIATTLGASTSSPNDTLLPSQWALAMIQANKAWEVTSGSPDVVVAVLDTGVALAHPDLRNKLVPGINILDVSKDTSDDNGHGTHVSGIISAEANNGLGIAGIAWGSPIMPVKVMGASGEGRYSDVADGIVWAVDHGARILNLSLGGYSYSQTLADAVAYAQYKNTTIVAAVGNDGNANPIYPAALPNVLGVAATDENDAAWRQSNRGGAVRLSAPGTNILSTTLTGAYSAASGTSVAAAHVSGVAALVLSANSALNASQLQDILFRTADDLGDTGLDPVFGHGRVNAARAVVAQPRRIHHVAINRVAIAEKRLAPGMPVRITVQFQNRGDLIEHALEIRLSINGQDIGTAKSTSDLTPGQMGEVVFEWLGSLAESTSLTILASIRGTQDDYPSLENTGILKLNTAPGRDGAIVLYEVTPPVHSWIAYQAFKLWPPAGHPAYTEMSPKFSPWGASDALLMDNIFTPGSVPASWTSGDGLGSGSTLLEGTVEEDLDGFLGSSPFNHFWNPDTRYGDGLLTFSSAPQKAVELWRKAVAAHQQGTGGQPAAYYWLGRIAHLLADMSVPAHVHLDAHPGNNLPVNTYDDSSYEQFTARATTSPLATPDAGKQYQTCSGCSATGRNMASIGNLPLTLPTSTGWESAPTDPNEKKLVTLMYNLAQQGQYFDSDGDGYNGNDVGGSTSFGLTPQAGSTRKQGSLVLGATYFVPESTTVTWHRFIDNAIFPLVRGRDYWESNWRGRILLSDTISGLVRNTADAFVVNYSSANSAGNKEIIEIVHYSGDIPDEELAKAQNVLEARAIEYTASLYKLFWDTMHPATSYSFTPAQLAAAGSRLTALTLPVWDKPSNQAVQVGSSTWYTVDLVAGQGVTVLLTAHLATGNVYAYLRDGAGTQLDSAWAYNGQTLSFSFTATTSGKYYLEVNGSNAGTGSYDLAVYNAWFNANITDASREYYGSRYTAGYLANGNFPVPEGNSRWFRFTASAGTPLSITASAHLNTGNIYAYVRDSAGTQLASAYAYNGQTLTLSGTVAATGVYYLEISGANAGYGTFDLNTVGALSDTDTDGDGLSNAAEYHRGTSASKADSDGDGISDKNELALGRDPTTNQAYSFTPSQLAAASTRLTALALPVWDKPSNQAVVVGGSTWYAMDLVAGQGVTVLLTAHVTNGNLYAYLRDASGIQLDSAWAYNDQSLSFSFTATTSGKYYVEVSGNNADAGSYDLAVYNAWFNANITDSSRDYYGTLYTASYLADGNFPVPQGNSRWFRFTAAAGTNLSIRASAHLNTGNIYAYLRDSAGTQIDSAYAYDGQTLTVAHTAATTGVYFLEISGANAGSGTFDLSASGSITNLITLTGSGTLVAPGNNNHNYTFANIDASAFVLGGKIDITINLGNGNSSSSYDLYPASYTPVSTGRPQNSLANAYDKSPGSTTVISYAFGPGAANVFKLGLEGNWFSPAGSTNTFTYSVVISGPTSISMQSDGDSDGDGLSNAAEYYRRTNPALRDSDGDGSSDSSELALGTDPTTNQAYSFTPSQLAAASTRLTALSLPVWDKPSNQAVVVGGSAWYAMDLVAGQGVTVLLTAHVTNGNLTAYLRDATGTQIDSSWAYNGQSLSFSFTATASGKYYLEVSGNNADAGSYDLAVYNAWFNANITDSRREYYGSRYTASYLADGNYSAPRASSRWFRFTATAGAALSIRASAHLNTGGNIYAYLRDSAGTQIDSAYAYDGQTLTLARTVAATGIYYLEISGANAGSGTFDLSSSGFQNSTYTLTQTISFTTTPTLLYGGTTTVSATATSGLAVTFSSTTPTVCTVSGNTVTAVTAGTCSIAASQAGNAAYSAAAQATQNITIAAIVPGAPTIGTATGGNAQAT
ncbi:MAG: S8 family serine peptidase, partial [Rhodocyclaceae bacterium]|nr:S8 family serine peptidase [Rhodocyclaceae bacterium]